MQPRILYLTPRTKEPLTGGQIFHVKAINYLRCKGHHVEALGWSDIPSWVRISKFKTNLWLFVRWLKRRKEILIEDSYLSSWLIMFNWFIKLLMPSVKIIISVQETHTEASAFRKLSLWHQAKNKFLWRLFLKSATGITAVSHYTKNYIMNFGIKDDKIKVVYTAPQELGVGGPKLSYDKEEGKPWSIIFIGQILPDKGQEYLVEALGHLTEKNVILNLVGRVVDREYRKRLNRLIEKHELDGRVRFIGWAEGQALAKLYDEAYVFVSPTLREAFPLVTLEAMSYGMPIIATNVGGIPEQIIDGINGLLVPPGDAIALANAIEKLLKDQSLRQKIGENAFRTYEKALSWDDVLGLFYNSFLEKTKII